MPVDPITLNIVGKALIAIPREMAANMRRASYSTVVREARDFSVGLLDASGEVVAQAEMIPMQTGGISQAFRAIASRLDLSDLGPDDALITNDSFDGGQHLQDIYIFSPIFVDGRLVGYGASVAHHLDIGGGMPGFNAAATEFYQEGIRIPATRFSVSRDWNGGFVENFIRANVRVPYKTLGDLNAQFAANNTADLRLKELVERYDADLVAEVMDGLQDYSERRIRDGISQIPDGIYQAEDFVDGTPWGLDRLRVFATVEVSGSDIRIDYTGTVDQIVANINCPLASTISAAQAAVRGVLHEKDIPFNEGCNRPISVVVPYGSLLNPRPPAAIRARMSPASRAFNAVIRALSQAVPDRVIASGFDTTTAVSLSYLDHATGDYDVIIEILGGGWGAAPQHDGMDALDNPLSNCANAPVETIEVEHRYFKVNEYRLRPDSGGPGRQRGGLGFERAYEAVIDGVVFSGYSDRHLAGARGLFGGEPGASGSFTVERASGTVETLPCVASVQLNRGDVLRIAVGGGGGYGNPSERDRRLIMQDIRQGRVTAKGTWDDARAADAISRDRPVPVEDGS
jgi:N-methylhydantoinase B